MSNLTYKDFAEDEFKYLVTAYNNGLRFNAMVSQAQRICECYLKHVINKSLINNNEVMMSHNLRNIYDYMVNSLGMDLRNIHSDIMCLNNFYTHTRYPGRDAFMASTMDIDSCIKSLSNIVQHLQRYL